MTALMPTPIPTATDSTRFCSGNARDTAVSASRLIRATKMLSTMLYIDWMSIERIGGTAIESSSRNTGRVPIGFSGGTAFVRDMGFPPEKWICGIFRTIKKPAVYFSVLVSETEKYIADRQ